MMTMNKRGEIFEAIVSSAFVAAATFQRLHGQKSPEEQREVLARMGRVVHGLITRPLTEEEHKAFEGLGIL